MLIYNIQWIEGKVMQNTIKMGELIGKGYKEFWNFKGRYRVVKGGRGSKKSCDTSIWII